MDGLSAVTAMPHHAATILSPVIKLICAHDMLSPAEYKQHYQTDRARVNNTAMQKEIAGKCGVVTMLAMTCFKEHSPADMQPTQA